MPHMAATLGLVDENQGSPHPVPSLLEHHPLKSQLSKDSQATTGSLYMTTCLVGGKRVLRVTLQVSYQQNKILHDLRDRTCNNSFCRCLTAREEVLIFECVFWSCGVGDTGGVSGLTRGLGTNKVRSIIYIDDCACCGHAVL